MMLRAALTLALSVTLVAGIVAQGGAPAPPINPAIAPTGGSVTLDTQTGQKIRVTAIATGLVHPWSLAFPDARTVLVTEQPGRLRVIRDGMLLPQPAWENTIPPNNTDGLHFVALHPGYARNHLVYVSYPKYGRQGSTLGISRGEFDGTTLNPWVYADRAGSHHTF